MKRSKPYEKLIYSWNRYVNDTLLGYMEARDFDVLYDSRASINENVDVLNSYLQFCIGNVVPIKKTMVYKGTKKSNK